MYIMATRKQRRQRKSRGNKRRGNRRITMRGGRAKPVSITEANVDGETVQRILVIAYGKTVNGALEKKIQVIEVTKDNILSVCPNESEIATAINEKQEIKIDIDNINNIEGNNIAKVDTFVNFQTNYNSLKTYVNNGTDNTTKIIAYCLAGVIKNKNGKRSIATKDNKEALLNFNKTYETNANELFDWIESGSGNGDGEWRMK